MKYRPQGMIVIAIGLLLPLFLVMFGKKEAESEAAMGGRQWQSVPTVSYAENEILVKMRAGISQGVMQLTNLRLGGRLKRIVGRDARLVLVGLPAGMTVEEAVTKYGESENVVHAQPNYIYHAAIEPDDVRFGDLWGLHNTGQYFASTPDADIDAPEAWDITTGSSEVIIGVIDTGIDYTHPDLSANIWFNSGEVPPQATNGVDDDGDLTTEDEVGGALDDSPGTIGIDDDGDGVIDDFDRPAPGGPFDGLDNDLNGYVDDFYGINAVTWNGNPASSVGNPFDDDVDGHGTHVSGTIGAVTDNAAGVAGINWNVRLMALKFLDSSGSGFTSDAVTCLEYAASMADAGVKLLATNNSWGNDAGILAYDEFLRDAIDQNRQKGILFIAAAGNLSEDNDSFYFLPASHFLPNVISVAASDYNDHTVSFSDIGKTTVHIGAPGQFIWSTIAGGSFARYSGTSMAAAHVTGVAALIKAQDMTRDWIDIRNLLLAGGDDKTEFSDTTITGKRLNANGALTCSGSVLLKRIKPSGDIVNTTLAREVPLAALHIDCDAPAGNVNVTVTPGGQVITLLDVDDPSLFQVAGDGIYSGSFSPPAEGIFTLDFEGADSVQVNAKGSSSPDIYADAGPDQAVSAGDQVMLDGSGSFGIGPEFQPAVIGYRWEEDPLNPMNVFLSGRFTAFPSFTAPTWTGGDETMDLIFRLTVSNNSGSAIATVKVTVTRPPESGGGGGGGGGGCFIATAAYGSKDAADVITLRQFRDRYLVTNAAGRIFVRLYYTLSPRAASIIADHRLLRQFVRIGLKPLVALAEAALATSALERFIIGTLLSLLFLVSISCMAKGRKKPYCSHEVT